MLILKPLKSRELYRCVRYGCYLPTYLPTFARKGAIHLADLPQARWFWFQQQSCRCLLSFNQRPQGEKLQLSNITAILAVFDSSPWQFLIVSNLDFQFVVLEIVLCLNLFPEVSDIFPIKRDGNGAITTSEQNKLDGISSGSNAYLQ